MGDAIGNFTHLNNNKGPSTIDYCLCNNELYDCIENFLVLPLSELSDHSKIVTVFKEVVSLPPESTDSYKWNSLNKRFKWNENVSNQFKAALKNSFAEINEICQRIEAGSSIVG